MTTPRAEIGREIPKNLQYLKEREVAFAGLLEVLKKITAGEEYILRLPDAAKKYSQFLSVSDREPLIKAIDDWNKNFLNVAPKDDAWARILSVVMSSGVNRCDVKSPGLGEVKRLIPVSSFSQHDIIAYVTALGIISPNEILQPTAHHEHHLKVRRMVYAAVNRIENGTDICMGAEYFVTGKVLWNQNSVLWESVQNVYNPYVLQVIKPIDCRG